MCNMELPMASYGFPNKSLINSCVRVLCGHFAEEQISGFKSGLHISDFRAGSLSDLKLVTNLAKGIAVHYRIPTDSFTVEFNDNLTRPARVKFLSSVQIIVELNLYYIHNFDDLLAVLAHEMTHVFLHRNGISFIVQFDNDVLTDVAATYMGLGTLILNGYAYLKKQKIRDNRIEITTGRYEYISPVELGYVLAKRSMRFGDDPLRYLSDASSDAFHIGKAELMDEYRLPPLETASPFSRWIYLWNRMNAARRLPSASHFRIDHSQSGYVFEGLDKLSVILDCRICSQHLQLPAFKGSILVRCPRCGMSYNCLS